MTNSVNQPDLFIFAGEQSGDLYGAQLLHALKEKNAQLKIFGVGGPKMRTCGIQSIANTEEFHVMGFVDVFLHLPKLFRLFYRIGNAILSANPKIVLLIDYPGFNLRLAKYLRKKGFQGKICQYICPSVWAWKKNRIFQMEKHLTILFSILPFEKELFRETYLNVQYVGHPLIKLLKKSPNTPKKDKKIISIFPGSRKQELLRNLPMQITAAKKLLEVDPNLSIAISIAQETFLPLVKKILNQHDLEEVIFVNGKDTYDLMQKSYLALAKSGTVILELALYQIPTIVTYGIGPIDLFIAKYLLRIRLPYYTLPNIILNEEVFPEFIGPHMKKEAVERKALELFSSLEARKRCQEKCVHLYNLLGAKDAAKQAALLLYENL